MTSEQYISAAASVAAFLAALATFLTVWQIAEQRKATYRPDIVVMRARVITTSELEDDSIAPLLRWKRSEEASDREDIFGNDYPMLLANIGLGAATNVSINWDFPMESFVSETRRLARSRRLPEEIEFTSNGALSCVNPRVASFWRNQKDAYLTTFCLLPSIMSL
jgi:hypothetical protein